MKFNLGKTDPEFRPIRNKIFVRTLLMGVGAVIGISLFYELVLLGRIGNLVILILENIFFMDYDSAQNFYSNVFRRNWNFFALLGTAALFLGIFRIYLNWFTRYFSEINRGIDELAKADGAEISLSPEPAAMEKKMNSIRHTLAAQKTEAQIAEQRKNDLIVYLAHDLKTPLTSVIGYLSLLRDEREISEELQEKYLSISLDKAERLEDLINEFFEITRFNLSEMELQYSRVNLTRLLEQLAFEFLPVFKEKNLRYTIHAQPDLFVKCDADKIQRVFDNLLRNAVYYCYDNTEITIRAVREGSRVRISFLNYGATISEEKIGRIFEQFYRLDSSRATNNGGAGLGLAIAKKIVELHGGKITVHSEHETITFEVWLPL